MKNSIIVVVVIIVIIIIIDDIVFLNTEENLFEWLLPNMVVRNLYKLYLSIWLKNVAGSREQWRLPPLQCA